MTAFPRENFILDWSKADLTQVIRQSAANRISDKCMSHLVAKILRLAEQSYYAVKKSLQ